jgi:hypothetical protein
MVPQSTSAGVGGLMGRSIKLLVALSIAVGAFPVALTLIFQ